MKFILISRHTDGAAVPAAEKQKNLEEMGQWIAKLKPEVAMPIRGGASVTANATADYRGDVGGVLIFEAADLEHAVALTKMSPGLKYGFTHDVFPEVSMTQAAEQDH